MLHHEVVKPVVWEHSTPCCKVSGVQHPLIDVASGVVRQPHEAPAVILMGSHAAPSSRVLHTNTVLCQFPCAAYDASWLWL